MDRAEKKLLFKLDILILPLTAALYLSASLDRSNAGNAKLQGLLKILGDNTAEQSQNYAIIFSAFYMTYIVFNVPGNILGSIISPDISLALGALVWGIASSAQAGAHSFAGILVCRLFIGLGEAGFGAAVPLYYALWYRRSEIATRISLYIGCGSLAGAFGGLIAYGVQYIKGSISTWRILFLIEGLPTIVLAICIGLFLPSTPERSRYLKASERSIIRNRLADSGVSIRHTFNMTAVKHVFATPSTYLFSVMYMGLNLSLASIGGFLPTIIQSFGYTAARAQLFTVPPYAVATVVTILLSYLSDKTRSRGIFVIICKVLTIACYVILLAVPHNPKVRYFATFLGVSGSFSEISLDLTWNGNNSGSQSAAAIRLAFMNAIGQTMSILASYMYLASYAPHYFKGFGLCVGFNVIGLVVAIYMTISYRRENARRNIVEGVEIQPAANARDATKPEVLAVEDRGKVLVDEKGVDDETRLEVKPDLHDLAPGFRYYV